MGFRIAIDGPAGAGKSTIAKRVAADRGYIYVDTGAMYRAMALFMIESGIAPDDTSAVARACVNADINIKYEEGIQCVYLNGKNVNELIRTEQVSAAASKTSAVREVRIKLVALQQDLARRNNVVMDGRDIGTKVIPDAELKIFLTASSEVRAKRRYDENLSKGMNGGSLEQIKAEIEERDYRDSHRTESPLVKAEDAVIVDTSDMTIDEVVAKVEELAG